MSYTCPYCGAESWHPKDIEYGYCGACHDFTRDKYRRETLKAQAVVAPKQRYSQDYDCDQAE